MIEIIIEQLINNIRSLLWTFEEGDMKWPECEKQLKILLTKFVSDLKTDTVLTFAETQKETVLPVSKSPLERGMGLMKALFEVETFPKIRKIICQIVDAECEDCDQRT